MSRAGRWPLHEAATGWSPRIWWVAVLMLAWTPRCCGIGVDFGYLKSRHEPAQRVQGHSTYARELRWVRWITKVRLLGVEYELASEGQECDTAEAISVATPDECQHVRRNFCEASEDVRAIEDKTLPSGCVIQPSATGKSCFVVFNTIATGGSRKGAWKICKLASATPGAAKAKAGEPVVPGVPLQSFWLCVPFAAAPALAAVAWWTCVSPSDGTAASVAKDLAPMRSSSKANSARRPTVHWDRTCQPAAARPTPVGDCDYKPRSMVTNESRAIKRAVPRPDAPAAGSPQLFSLDADGHLEYVEVVDTPTPSPPRSRQGDAASLSETPVPSTANQTRDTAAHRSPPSSAADEESSVLSSCSDVVEQSESCAGTQ